MSSNCLMKKITALGYENKSDHLSTFNEFVLKLEEDYINLYSSKKRDKFKNANAGEWFKSFKTYCYDLNLDIPDDYFNRNQLTDQQKEDLLNKLLNVSLSKKYERLFSDNKSLDVLNDNESNISKFNDDYKFQMDKLNCFLERLNLPLLNSDSKPSELKSALDLYLKINNDHLSATHKEHASNLTSVNGSFTSSDNKESFENISTNQFRSIYTDDLCKLQSELLWLTKEFSKLPTTK
ncbi:hypothetical protein MACK_003796 [Theileria orientalis]|uniref:Uncharacterized protein n=1 Tax=Theileria orientalis TaxID=68886 RepID=A0A976SIX5_THEOR|nr:hypothetical protein MACK_003796 [Theileria orientalis]